MSMRDHLPRTALLTALLLSVCCITGSGSSQPSTVDYRDRMRDLVEDISWWSKGILPSFIIVPQNGQELITTTGEPEGSADIPYLSAVDGIGREDLFFGYSGDDIATSPEETDWMISFLNIAQSYGKVILVTDYCYTHWKMDSSYSGCENSGFISFAADHRSLDNVPDYPTRPWNVNLEDVLELEGAGNFLYLIDPEQYSGIDEFTSSLSSTEYDLLIIDLFWNGQQLTYADVDQLRNKPEGGSRIVLAYMSIGEAEDYRYYWQQEWNENPPDWLHGENPDWAGNYLVEYWDQQWQDILYGSDGSYLDRIMDCGFDGVYLDKIDSYETWEEM